MSHPVLERRRSEQTALIRAAREWAERLAQRLDVVAAVVFGSVARGDFNKWSDIDVLVVARGLPEGARERLDLLMEDAPPGLQPVGWTPDELSARRRRGDPIARECDGAGVVVFGGLHGAGEP